VEGWVCWFCVVGGCRLLEQPDDDWSWGYFINFFFVANRRGNQPTEVTESTQNTNFVNGDALDASCSYN
jgi:hypothetical protein